MELNVIRACVHVYTYSLILTVHYIYVYTHISTLRVKYYATTGTHYLHSRTIE